RIGRTASLVNLEARHAVRGQIGKIERSAVRLVEVDALVAADGVHVGRSELAAIDRHQVELGTEAANGDVASFAVATLDRHAGDALQRFRQIDVGELADLFGRDRVDDTGRIFLDVAGLLKTRPDSGDDD